MKTLLVSLLSGFPLACSSFGAGCDTSASVVSSDTVGIVQEAAADGQMRDDTLEIAMTGDIMMGTTFPETLLPANCGDNLFDDVRTLLRSADLTVGNLEGTLCDSGKTDKKPSKVSYAFRTPTSYSRHLKDAGYDFLSMANNHAFDFGIEGVMSTERMLAFKGIKYAGIRGRMELAVVERDGIRYGLCAFGHNSYTMKHNDLKLVKATIDSLKTMSDIVVVSFHGGAEGRDKSHLPYGKETFLGEDRGSLRDFAHFCIDNGADVVYGHGPHVVRCMEVYKNRFIAYSLGNFCTPYGISLTGISGYAPVVTVRILRDGSFVDGKIHSFIQQRGVGPRIDANNAVAREIKSLTNTDIKDSKINISDEGDITYSH